MGTPALETIGTWTSGIHRYTYWIMPLHPLTQTAWYALFGFSVLSLRAYSIFWGVIALFSWLVIVRRLTGDAVAALVTFGLMATDYIFIQRSSEGRMDIMSAALGFAAIASYLVFREQRFTRALIVSHTLIAASCFTHPNGLLPLAALVFLTLYLDVRRIRFIHLAVTAVPYCLGVLGWWLYVSQAPELARIQLGGNASGRFAGLKAPFTALYKELTSRYLGSMGGLAPGRAGANRMKLLILAAYAAGVAGVLSTRALRTRPPVRALLFMLAIYFAMLTWWDGMKSPLYLIHILPFFIALLAIWFTSLWTQRPDLRWAIAAAGVIFITVQLGGVALVVKRDTYRNNYAPVIAYLRQHGAGKVHIMGSAELGFDLGFFENLTDDVKLGYESGKQPDYIVIETRYRGWIEAFREHEPAVYDFTQKRLHDEYRPAFHNSEYTIYARK